MRARSELFELKRQYEIEKPDLLWYFFFLMYINFVSKYFFMYSTVSVILGTPWLYYLDVSDGAGGTRMTGSFLDPRWSRCLSAAMHLFSLAVFSSKISLSKLHYSPITSNLLPHAWSIKCK